MNPKNQERREQYIANPNKCLTCGNPILPGLGQRLYNVRQKKFCNNSCAATVNNRLFPKKKVAKKRCVTCLQSFSLPNYRIKTYSDCRPFRTKPRNLENTSRREAGRAILGKHAARVMGNRPKACIVCGYDKFVDVCNITPVSTYSLEAKLKEVNAAENLVYLCPNHHREFDRGLISLSGG